MKTRKRFTSQEKVAILRIHLLERTPVSDLCDQHTRTPRATAHAHPRGPAKWLDQPCEPRRAVRGVVQDHARAAANPDRLPGPGTDRSKNQKNDHDPETSRHRTAPPANPNPHRSSPKRSGQASRRGGHRGRRGGHSGTRRGGHSELLQRAGEHGQGSFFKDQAALVVPGEGCRVV